jgi:hypothetical protein
MWERTTSSSCHDAVDDMRGKGQGKGRPQEGLCRRGG